jgi:hypothetical protein
LRPLAVRTTNIGWKLATIPKLSVYEDLRRRVEQQEGALEKHEQMCMRVRAKLAADLARLRAELEATRRAVLDDAKGAK